MTTILRIMIRVYGFLVRLYPRSFQREFTAQMLLDFSDMAVDARKEGKRALMFFCLRELVDLPSSLLRAHLAENRMFRLLRSRPVSTGLSSALGFGLAFGLTLPVLVLIGQKLYPWIDPLVTHLQVAYYDRFHAEQGFEVISWIPSGLSALLIGLVLGVIFAILFADRQKYPRYILAGMLGWFFYYAMHDVLTGFYSIDRLLDGAPSAVFSYLLRAFSGAVFGLIFVVAKSERPGVIRLLTISIFVYPLITFLFLQQLFEVSALRTLVRIVGLMILMASLVTSVFLLARKMEGRRKFPRTVMAGAIGYPLIMAIAHLIASLLFPAQGLSSQPAFAASTFWQQTLMFALEQAIYGTILGLLLGWIGGNQRSNNPPQLEVI